MLSPSRGDSGRIRGESTGGVQESDEEGLIQGLVYLHLRLHEPQHVLVFSHAHFYIAFCMRLHEPQHVLFFPHVHFYIAFSMRLNEPQPLLRNVLIFNPPTMHAEVQTRRSPRKRLKLAAPTRS